MIRLFGFVIVRATVFDAMKKRIARADQRAASRRKSKAGGAEFKAAAKADGWPLSDEKKVQS